MHQEGGLASRSSSRLIKDNAARKFEDLGKRASLMSSGDVILEAHSIMADVLKKDQFEMRSLEEVAITLGAKARKSKNPPAADVPKHKRNIGIFTPAASQEVDDSFAEETRYFNATHLFVCPECDKRFGGWRWLKTHVEYIHKTIWKELDDEGKLKRKKIVEQRNAAKRNHGAAENVVVAGAGFGDEDDLVQCTLVRQISEDTVQCNFIGTMDELVEHYWEEHPNFCGGDDRSKYPASLHCNHIQSGLSIVGGDIRFDGFTVAFLKNVCAASTRYPGNVIINYLANWFEERRYECNCAAGVPCSCVTRLSKQYLDALEEVEHQAQEQCHVGQGTQGAQGAQGAISKGRMCKTCLKPMNGHKRSNCRRPVLNFDFESPKRDSRTPEVCTPSTVAGSPPSSTP
jgi:hypothetical protein